MSDATDTKTTGTATWTHHSEHGGAWYIKLDERSPPPYLRQVRTAAILDLDAAGQLAGIELVSFAPAPPSTARDKPDQVFTPEEVSNLYDYQRSGRFHPFTCINRGDGKHIENGIDLGGLIPTTRGWICQYCDYTQNWAHDFTKKPLPPVPGGGL